MNDGCGYSAFKEYVRTSPELKARIDALRAPPAAEIYFDAIVALIGLRLVSFMKVPTPPSATLRG
jgi:hypothetical protein